VTSFFVAAIFGVVYNSETVPLDFLATPTTICVHEIEGAVAIFVVLAIVIQPLREFLESGNSAVFRALRTKVRVPIPVKVLAAAALILGCFVFAFWSIADVLGGYNGYGYSFAMHPILHVIHNSTIGLIPYIGKKDKGTQASFFFGVATIGMLTLSLGRGIGRALKDTATMFAAPALILFELTLWPSAPEDMTWHVTDYLWWGGTNDGGYRALDTGGAYIFSNWLLLAVVLLLVASRIPWLSLPSAAIWRRFRTQVMDWPTVTIGGPAGRNFSALGAFEPTTLRFLWPEQADESAKADHYSRKLMAPCIMDLPG